MAKNKRILKAKKNLMGYTRKEFKNLVIRLGCRIYDLQKHNEQLAETLVINGEEYSKRIKEVTDANEKLADKNIELAQENSRLEEEINDVGRVNLSKQNTILKENMMRLTDELAHESKCRETAEKRVHKLEEHLRCDKEAIEELKRKLPWWRKLLIGE